jgi:hypothetical protein
MRQFALKGGQLRISMQRERWERYNDRKRLESISSLLTIAPVLSVKWQCKGQLLRAKSIGQEREFAIRSLYLGESSWDYSDKVELVFSSHGRDPLKVRVAVGEPLVLHLKDSVQDKFGRRAK